MAGTLSAGRLRDGETIRLGGVTVTAAARANFRKQIAKEKSDAPS